MSLLKRLFPSVFLTKISVLIFFVIFFVFGFILGKNRQPAENNNGQIIKKNIITPTVTIKADKTPYCDIELSLMNQKYNITDPTSLLFAIRIPNFHQDWECYFSGYDEKGFYTYCRQKTCQSLKNLLWPEKPNQDQQKICEEELNSREYPRSFSRIKIEAVEYRSKNEIKDPLILMDKNKVRKTAKGINYEFYKTSKEKYHYQYSAVFYSPFRLTDKLSNFWGEFYGSEWIYGKYIITTQIVGDEIDNKVINLFEKIIDSVIISTG
ncbi:MAG: hypothetical protein QHH09_03530 [Microgenomates group bacterium]|nr:hypothetical protein [Microgenomates group bacterium]